MNPYAEIAYCINLDRRPDRWRAFRAAWISAGLAGEPERFRAVEPAPADLPHNFRGNIGAWGCLQSHCELFRRHLVTSSPCHLVIFEDDAAFTPNFGARFEAFTAELPADWQLAYLGGNHHFYGALWPTPITSRLARCRRTYTTHAYMIRREAISLVLSLPPVEPIDLLLCRVQEQLPCYCATPDLVTQAAGPSDVGGGEVDYGFIWKTQAEVFAGA